MKEKIQKIIEENGPQFTIDLAQRLSWSSLQVFELMTQELSQDFYFTPSYQWQLKNQVSPVKTNFDTSLNQSFLSRICQYYLNCLMFKDPGAHFTDADVAQNEDVCYLDFLPRLENWENDSAAIVEKWKDSFVLSGTQHCYLGFPLVKTQIVKQKKDSQNSSLSGENVSYEPLFLIPLIYLEFDESVNKGTLRPMMEGVRLNFPAFQRVSSAQAEEVVNEFHDVEEKLSLHLGIDPRVSPIDLVERLRKVSPQLAWNSSICMHSLIFRSEGSKYTAGLEKELKDLALMNAENLQGTALGAFVTDEAEPSVQAEAETEAQTEAQTERATNDTTPKFDLWQILSLNQEQQSLISKAMAEKLVVVTGPPGTGKSQLVTALAANAAKEGQKVLFASRNNKAVDVVEERLNNLTSSPVMLRLGSNLYFQKTKQLIERLLSSLALQNEHSHFDTLLSKHHESAAQQDGNQSAIDLQVWQSWLQNKIKNISSTDRKNLSKYKTLFELLSEQEGSRVYWSELNRNYQKVLPLVQPLLPVWATTSLSARGRLPFLPGFFDLLIVDEASQCDIPSILPLLYRAKRVLIIGDSNQLRHIPALTRAQDIRALAKYDLLDEGLPWAYSIASLFDLGICYTKSENLLSLKDHYRSLPEIIQFSNEVFYNKQLRVQTKTAQPYRFGHALELVNVKSTSTRPTQGSLLNSIEAQRLVEYLIEFLSKISCPLPPFRIGIISPFRAQVNLIRQLLNQKSESLLMWREQVKIIVDTVHKFQGDECEVILFSLAGATGISEASFHFLQNNPHLFNVALSRAKEKFVLFGNTDWMKAAKIHYLHYFLEYHERNLKAESSSEASDKLTHSTQSDHLASLPEERFYPLLLDYLKKWSLSLVGGDGEEFRVLRQFAVGPYFLDFAVMNKNSLLLNIEIDGEIYHGNRQDGIRDEFLSKQGWTILRLPAKEILTNGQSWQAKMDNILNERQNDLKDCK